MAWEIFPRSKKQKDKDAAEWRKAKGDAAEDIRISQLELRGNSVQRRDQRKGGWDLTVTTPSGAVRHEEVKANPTNKTTSRQDKQAAKDPKWRRVDMNMDSTPGTNVLVEGTVIKNRLRKKKIEDMLGF